MTRFRLTLIVVVSFGLIILAAPALAAPGLGLRPEATRVASTRSTADPVVAAAGDIACDPASAHYNGGSGTSSACRMKATSDLLVNTGLAKVLTLGDNQYENGALAKFQTSYAPTWGRVKSITRPTVGNHEYGTPGASAHFDYFGTRAGRRGKGYYSFDVGAWHLIALNSNCSKVGGCGRRSPQEKWLRADLAAHSAVCTLAYWHHPRFSSGPHGNSLEMGAFWRTLYAAGADVVLSGHDHSYERFAPQTPRAELDLVRGIREFVVGTGGKTHYGFSSVKPNSEARDSSSFGVLRLTLHAASYDWSFVPAAGETFTDSGTGACH